MGSDASTQLGYGIWFDDEKINKADNRKEAEEHGETLIWRKQKELEEMGLEIMYAGDAFSEESPGMGIAIKETYFHTWEITPKSVTLPEIKEEWKETLQKACELLGLEYQEPQWWLSAYYG